MLLAVLHRHGGIGMFDQDVYVNMVGGVQKANKPKQSVEGLEVIAVENLAEVLLIE